MKYRLSMVAIISVIIFAVAGCGEFKNKTVKPWREGPYHKVAAYESPFGTDYAEAWVRGEPGDKFGQELGYDRLSKRQVTLSAHLVRKDKTRLYLPLRVHADGDPFAVHVVHLVDKNEREFDFLRL